jgi:bifunctional oligoribonuclease and PAP phosphatase NrnA
LVAPEYVATAEILADIFKIWKIKLNGEIASSLYIGIYTDSGGFKYKTTTPRTYEIAAELVKFIPDFSEIISNTENGNDKKYIEYLGAALNSVEFYLNDKVIVSAVAYDDILKMQIEKEDTSSVNTLNDILRSIEGIEISATFVEEEKGLVRVSMRALRDEFDVSKIAVIFGGGGHKLAAGMNMKMPLDQAKEEFRKAVTEAYGDLLK